MDESAGSDNMASLDDLIKKKEQLARLKEDRERRIAMSKEVHGREKKEESGDETPLGWQILSEERNAFGLRKR